ncbi:hypothetical protein KUTeg_014644 [Tegillarca granosa]|uniref:VWA N-terminal domain-containing protein n=1 Tax=Tegillarca granosa TaxID=220873 RepID=A0ABQ9ERL9_TEGGR|nr:hypothetical protein KUTeg_014644 [Tegillarca granosa]
MNSANARNLVFIIVMIATVIMMDVSARFPGEEKHEMGTLEGDVQNWAILIQNYILQTYLDQANYTFEVRNGEDIVNQVKDDLGEYFKKKKRAAQRLAKKIQEIYDEFFLQNKTLGVEKISELDSSVYYDSDIPKRLPNDLTFIPYFKQEIADEVPRDDNTTISSVIFTAGLEEVFKQNKREDPLIRWQYFGSTSGIVRIYPGREWSTTLQDFTMIMIPDYGLGQKFTIAQAVAKTVINTLTKQDYVNVICARASHWDEVGKWKFFQTSVLSCQENNMVPATTAHRKDLIEKIEKLKPGGTSELEKGFEKAYELLRSVPRTGCQSIIIFATDGKDTDGYYTRSGYVPGPWNLSKLNDDLVDQLS